MAAQPAVQSKAPNFAWAEIRWPEVACAHRWVNVFWHSFLAAHHIHYVEDSVTTSKCKPVAGICIIHRVAAFIKLTE